MVTRSPSACSPPPLTSLFNTYSNTALTLLCRSERAQAGEGERPATTPGCQRSRLTTFFFALVGSHLIVSDAHRRALSCLFDWPGQRSSIWRGRRVQDLELARGLVDRWERLAPPFVVLNLPEFIHGFFLAFASEHAPSRSSFCCSCPFCTRLAEDAPRRSIVGKLCGMQTAQSSQLQLLLRGTPTWLPTIITACSAPQTITTTPTLSLKSSTDHTWPSMDHFLSLEMK